RPARLGADVVQVAAHAVAGTQHVARDALVLRDDRLGVAAQVDVDVAALHALDDTGHQLANAVLPLVDDLGALGFPDALHDDLLGSLRGDAAEAGILDLLLDVVADLDALDLVDGVHQADLAVGRLHDDVIGHHLHPTEGLVAAILRIDLDPHQDVLVLVTL